MKKWLAIVLVFALTLGLFGCGKVEKVNHEEDPEGERDDGLVSVWLKTSETSCEPDGSRGYSHITYTYTDKGLPLTVAKDIGPQTQEWSDEYQIYEYLMHPYDDLVDYYLEYFYNDHGDLLYYQQTTKSFDINGEEVSSYFFADGKDANFTYHYDENGKITSVDMYPPLVGGGHGDEVNAVMHYCYDDNGNLIEIYSEVLETGVTMWKYDYRYDSEGRLIGSTKREREACWYWQYEYDDQGRLAAVPLSTGYWQIALDDQQVAQTSSPNPGAILSPQGGSTFTYDDQGNLISRNDTQLTYSGGKLSTVTYADGTKYVYVDNESEADPDAITLVRDGNGNVVKAIHPEGGYVEYTYQEFRLTPEEAVKCQNYQFAYNRVSPTENKWNWFTMTPANGLTCLPLLPSTPLLFTDILEKQ